MKPPTLRTACFLAIDVALLLVCVLYVPALFVSARAPFGVLSVGDHLRVVQIIDQGFALSLRLPTTIDEQARLSDGNVKERD